MDKASSAMTGLVAGTAGALAADHRNNNETRRRLERVADDNRRVETSVEGMRTSGDWLRLKNDQVSDLLAGVASPNQAPDPQPSAFASPAASLSRPNMTEAQAVAPSGYPVATNAYDNRGNLKQPDAATVGELYLTGVSLTHPSVRAMLLGLAHDGEQPTQAQLAQVFRNTAALEEALRELAPLPNSPGMTVEALKDRWTEFFGGRSTFQRGQVYALTADSTEISNNNARSTYTEIPVPAGFLDIGQSGLATFNVWIPSSNAADTLTLFVVANGTPVFVSRPKDPNAAGDGLQVTLKFTRRPNNATGAVYAVSAISEGNGQLLVKTFSVSSPDGPFNIGLQGQWSAADAANVSLVNLATLDKQ